MVFPALAAQVFHPVHCVVGNHIKQVKHVSIGENQVGIAILVKIHQVHSAGAEGRIVGSKNDLLPKGSITPVQEGNHRLMFLADDSHEICIAVLVQVHHGQLNTAVTIIQQPGVKDRYSVMESLVFQVVNMACTSPAKFRDDQVQVAVGVKIRSLDIGHAPDPVKENVAGEFSRGIPADPGHFPFLVIFRKETSQVRDQDVGLSIAIQVGD